MLGVDHRVEGQRLLRALHTHRVEAAQVRAQEHGPLLGVTQPLQVLLPVAAHAKGAGLAAQEEERVDGALHEAAHVPERGPEAQREPQAPAQLVPGVTRHAGGERVVERDEEPQQARGPAAEHGGQHHHGLDAQPRAVLGDVAPAPGLPRRRLA